MALRKLVYSVALLLGLSATVNAYGSGSPPTEQVCKTLIPGHKIQPQSSLPPFEISTSSTNVRTGQPVTITVNAKGGTFQGFMLVARKANSDDVTPFGKFIPQNGDQKAISCFDIPGSALTHTSKSEKNSVTATWNAPAEKGQYNIMVVYARDFSTFWPAQPSQVITVQ